MTYNIPLQKYTITRSSEKDRVNPAYLNLSLEKQFEPVKGVKYLWILNPDNEVILGIEEPWMHPDAFGVEQEQAFESLMKHLRAPAEENVERWKFGHPTLAVHFDTYGNIDEQGCAYIGGELYFDNQHETWVLDNMSGRYGEYEPFTGLENEEAEKRYQKNIIESLYGVLTLIKPFIGDARIKPSFDQALFDPQSLSLDDLLFNLSGSLNLYPKLGEAEQVTPLYVKAYVADNPLRLTEVNAAFFVDAKESAAELLEKATIAQQYTVLVELLPLNQYFAFIDFYIQKILNTKAFSELLALFERDTNPLKNLFSILDIKALIVQASPEVLKLLLPLYYYYYYSERTVDLTEVLWTNKAKLIEAFSENMSITVYQNLPKRLRVDSEIVGCFMNRWPVDLIEVIDADFFIYNVEHAKKYLDKGHGYLINSLIIKHSDNQAFLEFIRCYLEGIFHTPRFLKIIKCIDSKSYLLLWFGFQRIMDKLQTIDLTLLKLAKKLDIDLTGLNFQSLPLNIDFSHILFEYESWTIFNLLPVPSRYRFLSQLMLSPEDSLTSPEKLLKTLNFKELAQLIHINPVHFSTVLTLIPDNKVVSFMHFLVDLDLGTRFIIDGDFRISCLFDLVYDSSIVLEGNKKGLTLSPVHAALLKLRIKTLTLLFQEFVEIFIYNTQMIMNLLASMEKAVINPYRKLMLIGTLIDRFAELTHNKFEYEKIRSSLPSKKLQDAYDFLMESKCITNNDMPLARRAHTIPINSSFSFREKVPDRADEGIKTTLSSPHK